MTKPSAIEVLRAFRKTRELLCRKGPFWDVVETALKLKAVVEHPSFETLDAAKNVYVRDLWEPGMDESNPRFNEVKHDTIDEAYDALYGEKASDE